MRSLYPILVAALLFAAPAGAAEPTTFRTTAAKSAVPVQPREGTFTPRKQEAERQKQRAEALTQRIKDLQQQTGKR